MQTKGAETMKCLGGCASAVRDLELKTDGYCCDSCHIDEEEYNYSMSEIETEKGYYIVCCVVANAWQIGAG
jgi:hypothetical protein